MPQIARDAIPCIGPRLIERYRKDLGPLDRAGALALVTEIQSRIADIAGPDGDPHQVGHYPRNILEVVRLQAERDKARHLAFLLKTYPDA